MTDSPERDFSKPYENRLPQDKRRRNIKVVILLLVVAYALLIISSMAFA